MYPYPSDAQDGAIKLLEFASESEYWAFVQKFNRCREIAFVENSNHHRLHSDHQYREDRLDHIRADHADLDRKAAVLALVPREQSEQRGIGGCTRIIILFERRICNLHYF